MNQLLDDWSKLGGEPPKKINSLLKNGTRLHLLVVLVAAGLAFYDVETIVAMGPVCSILAALLLIFNNKKIREYKLLATSTLLFCLFIFLLIVGLNWSPSDAQWPVSILGGIYSIWLLFFYSSIATQYSS